MEIEIGKVHPNKNQPRHYFDEEKLKELSSNMKKHGQLQPITVRPDKEGYEIVIGERRYRAAKLANFSQLKCTVKEMTDEEAFDISASENLQRDDLNPMEEALVYKHYKDKGMKLKEIAEKVDKTIGRISQIMSILKAHNFIQVLLSKNKLTMEQGITLQNMQKRFDRLMKKYEKYTSRVGYGASDLLTRCFSIEYNVPLHKAINDLKELEDNDERIFSYFVMLTIGVDHIPDHLASRIAFDGLKATSKDINQATDDIEESVKYHTFYDGDTLKEEIAKELYEDFIHYVAVAFNRSNMIQTNDAGKCWWDGDEWYHTSRVGIMKYSPILKKNIWFCTICAEKHKDEIESIFKRD